MIISEKDALTGAGRFRMPTFISRNKSMLMSIAAFVCTSSTPALAHDIKIASATGLLANCTYQSDDQAEIEFHIGLCLGFIKAVMNMHPTNGETFCIPEDLDNKGLIGIVRDALYRLPPEMMHAASHTVIGVVFELNFPCVRK